MRYSLEIIIIMILISCGITPDSKFSYDGTSVYDVKTISEQYQLSYQGILGGFRDSATQYIYYIAYFEDTSLNKKNIGLMLILKPLSNISKNFGYSIPDTSEEGYMITTRPIVSTNFTLNEKIEFKILDAVEFKFSKSEMVTYGNVEGLPGYPDAVAVEPKIENNQFLTNNSDTIKRLWYLNESMIRLLEIDASYARRMGAVYMLSK